jgi:hypothetical protein
VRFRKHLVLAIGVTCDIDIIFFVNYDLYICNWGLDCWQRTMQDSLEKLKLEEV